MGNDIRLTSTSYIVLGLVEAAGEATPYELKKTVAAGLVNFWTIHHAQLYAEPKRLAEAGFLNERRETAGRRRKQYTTTEAGREALRQWLSTPTKELTAGRIPSFLKLALGGDPKALAENQLPAQREKLAEYEALQAQLGPEIQRNVRIVVDLGVEMQQELVRYWKHVAERA
jgi:DNA-binding PadR family transcriptional regulator